MFDLELPEDFTPVNADGEMGSFQLLSISEVSVTDIIAGKSDRFVNKLHSGI